MSQAPKRTFTEMAEEFGLTRFHLAGIIAHSKHHPPQPVMIHRNSRTCRNQWYDVAEMRAWWKRHNEAEKA